MFEPILKSVLENLNSQQILENGFRPCGLCPFNPDAIDYTKLLSKNRPSNELSVSRNISKLLAPS